MLVKKSIIFLAFLLFAVLPVYAESLTPTQTTGESLKTQIQTSKETRQQTIQAFKQRIQQIQDARKRLIVEKINSKIASSNTRLTGKMVDALDKLTSILDRIKVKAATLKADGKDTTKLEEAIAAAEKAIADAKTAVIEQAQKQYSVEIPSDGVLKNAIGQMVSQFRQDIKAVHKLVVDAKQAVSKAISELAQLRGVGNINATSSGNIND